MSQENQQTEVQDERDWESEAKAQGWNPDFDGPNAKSAREFVEVGERIDYKKELRRLKTDMGEMKKAAQAFHSMAQKQAEKAQKERDFAVAELDAIQKRAITEGDGDAFERAEKQKRQLAAEPIDAPDLPPSVHAAALEFQEKYAEALSDPVLENTAAGIADSIRRKNPSLDPDSFFEELSSQLDVALRKFNKTPSKVPPKVEGGERSGSRSSNGKSFSDLPPEAQKAYHSWAKDLEGMGVKFSKEEYLAEYQWDGV